MCSSPVQAWAEGDLKTLSSLLREREYRERLLDACPSVLRCFEFCALPGAQFEKPAEGMPNSFSAQRAHFESLRLQYVMSGGNVALLAAQ